MTKILLLFFCIVISSFSHSWGRTSISSHATPPSDSVISSHNSKRIDNYVYLCTGSYAYAYHSSSTCAGLSNCQGTIVGSLESAALSTNRVPCCRCWTNVSDRCKDDANPGKSSSSATPNYGSGGGGEAYIIIAAATVVAGVFIISNEISVSRIQSFYNFKKDELYPGQKQTNSSGAGWDFRLRMNFDKSGLEYGTNYVKYSTTISDSYSQYTYTDSKSKWSFYIDYVHDIKVGSNDKLKLYTGPTIKYLDKFGYGGIAGIKYQLFPGFSPDLRYEYTSQSNQLQLGIQILYKKPKG